MKHPPIAALTVADYEQHISLLCTRHKIKWETASLRHLWGRAWRKERKIRVSEINGAEAYAVALHEIGHVVGKKPPLRLAYEWEAWVWAMAWCEEWTDAMTATMQSGLRSYVNDCYRPNGTMRYKPLPASHPIWEFISYNPESIKAIP